MGEMADEWEDRCEDARYAFEDGCWVWPVVEREFCPKCRSKRIYLYLDKEDEIEYYRCRDCDYDEKVVTEAGGLSNM